MRPQTRFEIKYRIPPPHAEAIRRWVPRYMQPDEFGEGGEPVYNVHSLYLDDSSWSIFHDTADGAFKRFKLRARCYGWKESDDIFLEVKSRTGESMRKSRHRCARAEARHVLAGGIPNDRPSEGLENFRHWMDQRHAYPRVWVTYRRYAYVGGERGLVRVTFDDRIACAPATPDLSEPPVWTPLPQVAHLVVLEVKYTGSYPAWVGELVRQFDLTRHAMSKYKQAVEVLQRPTPRPIQESAP